MSIWPREEIVITQILVSEEITWLNFDPNKQGWTLNFESTRHSGEWPSKCTRPDQFSLVQRFTSPIPHVFPTILVIFYFYFWMTIEIYFNTKRLLTSRTVNRKSVSVSLPSSSFSSFIDIDSLQATSCSLIQRAHFWKAILASWCVVVQAVAARLGLLGFFSFHNLALWYCFARRWAALFLWHKINSVL